MKSMNTLLLLCSTVVAMPVAAEPFTGDDVIIMRRVITPSIWQRDIPMPSPTPSQQPTPTPAAIAWSVGDWTFTDANTCSSSAHQVRTVACPGGDEAKCVATKPNAERQVERLNGCTFAWQPGAYTNYDSSCSDAAHRSIVTAPSCVRSDGQMVDETHCSGSQRPDDALVKPVYDGCTVEWAATNWSDWSNTCATTSMRTRAVVCQRVGKDVKTSVLPDTSCSGGKPTLTETAANYGSCTYSWTRTAVGSWSSGCSSQATRVNTYRCDRSNGDKDVDATFCGDAPPPERTLNTYSCATIIKDPGFEEGTNWTYDSESERATDRPHSGKYSAMAGISETRIAQKVMLEANSHYRISFWARTIYNTVQAVGLKLDSGLEIIPLYESEWNDVGSNWTHLEAEFIAPQTGDTLVFDKAPGVFIYVDDISITAIE